MAITNIKIRCPKKLCRSEDIKITGTSNCTCNNCGTDFIFPGAKIISQATTITHHKGS